MNLRELKHEEKPKKIYLASPYSSTDPGVMLDRFHMACKKSGEIMGMGHFVYSPIAHSHPIALHMDNNLDHEFWLKQCFAMLEWADEMWVYKLNGWFISKGIHLEIAECNRIGIPVRYIDYDQYGESS